MISVDRFYICMSPQLEYMLLNIGSQPWSIALEPINVMA